MINKLPLWLQAIIYIAVLWFSTIILNFIYEDNPLILIIIWLSIPLVILILGVKKYFDKLTDMEAIRLKIIATALAIIISFFLFANYNRIRDDIGKKYIEGYHSEYYDDTDTFGRPALGVSVYTERWYTKVILWAGSWVFLLMLVGVPYITYRISENYINMKDQTSDGYEN